jgi:hypothetical protein
MMPIPLRRKARTLEKVEILYCTATTQKILPTRFNKSVHARAMRGSAADTIKRCVAMRHHLHASGLDR